MDTSERFEALPEAAPVVAPAGWRARAGELRVRLETIFEVGQGHRRLLPMEGIRGLAIILVFFVHFHAVFGGYAAPASLVFRVSDFMGLVGNTGVDLFFVLSGYLIYGAVIRKRSGFLAFMRRRVERIYPTFLAVLTLYLALSLLVPQHSKLPAGGAAALLYVVQNLALLPGLFAIDPIISVAWSLSYEMFFYLSVPLIVGMARLRHWTPLSRIALFGSFGVVWLASNAAGVVRHPRFAMFAIGILLYELGNAPWFCAGLRRFGEILAFGVFAASFPVVYFVRRQYAASATSDAAFLGPLHITILCLGFFWFVAYCIFFDGFLARAFSWTPLRWLGNMSYSYYLLHGVTLKGVALVVTRLFPPSGDQPLMLIGALPVAFLATVLTSSSLFILIEKPFSLRPPARSDAVSSGARRETRA